MAYAAIAFFVFFLLVGSGLLLAFYREVMGQRLAAILGTRTLSETSATSKIAESVGAFADSLQKVVPKSEKETSVVRKRLILAGYRKEHYSNIFYASKAVMPVLLAVLLAVTGAYHWNPILGFVLAGVVGYLVPDYWLGHRIKARQEALRIGLPDTLDLLVVCLEAGLSLDQAVLRASDELIVTHPVISDELGLVMLEIRAGKPRLEAWRALTERSDETSIRMLVSILIQADQFGIGISKTLRIHSDTIRTQRTQRVEEMAAKTAVKLVFPLALLIFPSVYVVAVGSAFIQIAQVFEQTK
jgi:tight adherence protein C